MKKRSISFPKPQRATKLKIPSYILSGSKYKNVPKRYKGRLYHSTKEMNYAIYLDSELHAGRIKSWEPQFTLRLVVNGKLICKYLLDFLVTMPDGSQQAHEVKGMWTAVGRVKFKLAQALYSDIYKFVLIK